MKFFSKFKTVIILSSICVALFSCEEDKKMHPDYREGTILKTAYTNPNLTIFVDALLITNLSELLIKNEPYTVFAPTNEAFNKFFIKSNYASLGKVPIGLLKQLILNHIVLGNVSSTSISAGYIKTLAKSSISQNNTMSMYVDVVNGVKLNGIATVTTPNILTTNGTIHIVDGVLDFPMITTHLELNPKLSSILNFAKTSADPALLEKISLPKFYEKDKQQYFDVIAPVTIFAPTNDAFTSLNTELLPAGIAGQLAANLTKIFSYHAVSQNMLSSSWVDNKIISSNLLVAPAVAPATVGTFESFTVQFSNGKKIKDVRNRIADIETTDIQCWNGVIHVVNKVLLPNLPN